MTKLPVGREVFLSLTPTEKRLEGDCAAWHPVPHKQNELGGWAKVFFWEGANAFFFNCASDSIAYSHLDILVVSKM